ncbi:iron-containing alcohol dehydrogenase [Parvularcula marina]|uniref:Alcohol dehydrogenase 2 n=1 Tax=Parvularcula marina TaxID=2292771 RepID=A0A371RHI9_9PROT|nr:iron-containing alcohol dehydrogenase [Parvularcula marina]
MYAQRFLRPVFSREGEPRVTDFQFLTVPKIYMKAGAARTLGDYLAAESSVSSIFLVTDRGVREAGLLDNACASLSAAGVKVTICDDVVADPPEQLMLDMTEKARSAGCDGYLGLGGGSSLDAAKLLAVLAEGEQDLASMYGIDQIRGRRKPLFLVPTTAGTGSEVTPIAIVTTGETTKSGIVSPVLYADAAILDPELTIRLPGHVTAATGLDAMVHAIEAYTSRHKKNPISDALALKALSLLSAAVPAAYDDGTDLTARSDALLGSMLAGQAFANAPVAGVHALAYPLGGIFHLPHGLSNALVLPYVLEFNALSAKEQYAELYTHLTGDGQGGDESRAGKFAHYMSELCERVGLRQQLRDLGVPQDRLSDLASDAMKQTRLLINNPREISYEDALSIYEQAW